MMIKRFYPDGWVKFWLGNALIYSGYYIGVIHIRRGWPDWMTK